MLAVKKYLHILVQSTFKYYEYDTFFPDCNKCLSFLCPNMASVRLISLVLCFVASDVKSSDLKRKLDVFNHHCTT